MSSSSSSLQRKASVGGISAAAANSTKPASNKPVPPSAGGPASRRSAPTSESAPSAVASVKTLPATAPSSQSPLNEPSVAKMIENVDAESSRAFETIVNAVGACGKPELAAFETRCPFTADATYTLASRRTVNCAAAATGAESGSHVIATIAQGDAGGVRVTLLPSLKTVVELIAVEGATQSKQRQVAATLHRDGREVIRLGDAEIEVQPTREAAQAMTVARLGRYELELREDSTSLRIDQRPELAATRAEVATGDRSVVFRPKAESNLGHRCAVGPGTLTVAATPTATATIIGSFIDGLPHGHGVLQLTEGGASTTYTGDWNRGMRHGRGAVTDAKSGAPVFAGSFASDRPEGQGEWYVLGGTVSLRGLFASGAPSGDLIVTPHQAHNASKRIPDAAVESQRGDPVATVNPTNGTVAFSGAAGEFKGQWQLRFATQPSATWRDAFTAGVVPPRDVTSDAATEVTVDRRLAAWAQLQQALSGLHRVTRVAKQHMEASRASQKAAVVAAAMKSTTSALEADYVQIAELLAAAQRAKKRHDDLSKELEQARRDKLLAEAAATQARSRCDAAKAQIADVAAKMAASGLSDTAAERAIADQALIESAPATLRALDERLANANKRIAAARLTVKNTKQLAAALEKRIEGQAAVVRDLEKQLELTLSSRASSEVRLNETASDYDRKISAEIAAVNSEKDKLAVAERDLAEARTQVAQIEKSIEQLDDEDATNSFDELEARVHAAESELESARVDLEKRREARNEIAAQLAVVHQAEKDAKAEQLALERQVEQAREALRRRRQAAEERDQRLSALEAANQAAAKNRDGSSDDTEEDVLARHKRNLQSFNDRERRALAEAESLRIANDAIAVDIQNRMTALAEEAQEAKRTPTPPPPQSPVAVRSSKSRSPTPDEAARLSALRSQIASLTASHEAASAEAKRMKELKDAPPWMSLHAPACSASELKALQAQIKTAISDVDADARSLRNQISQIQTADAERRKAIEARRKAAREATASGNDWRMKALQEALESRDTRIADLKMQVSRIKQLEAKLAVASDTVAGMSVSVEAKQQHALSKQKSDVAWAAARTSALSHRSTAFDGANMSKSKSSHF